MPRGRPPKALTMIEGHLTKEQRSERERAEREFSSSVPFKKWPQTKKDSFASKHFDRIKKAFEEIGVCDVSFEAVINRYCIILGECAKLEKKIEESEKLRDDLDKERENMEAKEYASLAMAVEKDLYSKDCSLGAKRNALLQIEKENIMTVLAKLRAVPKKPKEREEEDPMEAILAKGDELAARRMKKSV